jgi:hypothetical protein
MSVLDVWPSISKSERKDHGYCLFRENYQFVAGVSSQSTTHCVVAGIRCWMVLGGSIFIMGKHSLREGILQ